MQNLKSPRPYYSAMCKSFFGIALFSILFIRFFFQSLFALSTNQTIPAPAQSQPPITPKVKALHRIETIENKSVYYRNRNKKEAVALAKAFVTSMVAPIVAPLSKASTQPPRVGGSERHQSPVTHLMQSHAAKLWAGALVNSGHLKTTINALAQNLQKSSEKKGGLKIQEIRQSTRPFSQAKTLHRPSASSAD